MFFDKKTRIFRKLRRLLRELNKVEDNVKKNNFKEALKELRKGFIKNKKFLRWIKKHHSEKIDERGLQHGTSYLNKLFAKTTATLMELKEKFGEKDYDSALEIINKMRKLVIWEIKDNKEEVEHNLDVIESSQEEIIKKIKDIDRKLVKIIEEYGLDDPINFINIKNKKKEKRKFMRLFNKGITYNPQFKYKSIPESVLSKGKETSKDVMRQLRELKINFNKGPAYLVKKKIINLKTILKLVRSIGTNKITKHSIALYSFPSDDLIKEAYAALEAGKKEVEKQLDKKTSTKRYSAKDLKKKANAFFKENNMPWETVIKTNKDMDGRFRTFNTEKEFWVNKEAAPFSEKDIVKAIQHEIKVHAYRSESGKKSPLKILAYGASGYLPTEEGLTTYFEDLKNATNPVLQRKKYLYVVVESIAISKGFYDCFAYLTEHGVEPDLAWDVVVRIKRGLSNTGQRGGFFKDHVYFLGDKLISKFIASGGNANDLMGGKIGLNDVKHIVGKYRL